MKIGIFINARLNSKRLPNKHLKEINGKPALQWLVDRLAASLGDASVLITSGEESVNRDLVGIKGCPVVWGHATNIPLRHLLVAVVWGYDAVISLDGDDLLVSMEAIKDCIDRLLAGASLVRTKGLPYGMNVTWGYNVRFLASVLNKVGIYELLDTNWGWIFDEEKCMETLRYRNIGEVRLSLDTEDDLSVFRRVFTDCPLKVREDPLRLVKWIEKYC